MTLKTSPFKNSVAAVKPPIAVDSDEVKVATAIPGSTMLILEDGTILMGQLQLAGKVRVLRGQKDPQGRQAYTVEWAQCFANVTPTPKG